MTGYGTDARFGALRHLWFSPVRCFRARLERSPRHAAALTPLAAYLALTSAAMLVVSAKTSDMAAAAFDQAGLPPLFPAWVNGGIALVSSVATGCFLFALWALAAVVLDMLFAQSGRGRRLVEFTALSYWSQLPYAVVWLGMVAWWWHPEPLRLPPGVTTVELMDILRTYQEESANASMLSTLRLTASYSWCWLVALQAAALRVVSGFTAGGAWAAGVSLATLFVGAPYAFEAFW